ncbi:hypothetical protein VZT92_010876 [Zoarces viviparus]|uniref:WxxW domain-containing protein n=1 Tax=Zoarces viviparus TaxID=48416 RepID=A0AAW1FB86_ZOAVI
MNNLLSVAILAGCFFASNQQQTLGPFTPVTEGPVSSSCWTQWFDRGDPSGSGDWETLRTLRIANPGKICPNPLGIEVRTLTGLTVAQTGDVIYRSDATTGFVCRNRDQRGRRRRCNDYRVRFSCHPRFCGVQVCWTDWFDRDDPSGTGDWEILFHLRKENPGKLCPTPVGIEAQTLTGLSVAAAGDVIYSSDTTTGFACRNRDQRGRRNCNDYRVRFSCRPPFCDGKVCWTNWYDRDNPSGTGDWELLVNLRDKNPGQICSNPLHIEAVTTDTNTPAIATGDAIYVYNQTQGFACRNRDQKSHPCRDYKVRFGCPCRNEA